MEADPPYGSLSPSDERGLWQRDRAAWARYVAPWWVEKMQASDEVTRVGLWHTATPELRAAIVNEAARRGIPISEAGRRRVPVAEHQSDLLGAL